uniref:Uncharacterized protein n=1 Tax=Mirabilis himalaica TaxID=482968 RepID=A0A6M9TTD6_9CARY|nr:hypothetical protein [Mirabilis himalaica]QKN19350.1 hypothetical protein [Mirabilis himalaica]
MFYLPIRVIRTLKKKESKILMGRRSPFFWLVFCTLCSSFGFILVDFHLILWKIGFSLGSRVLSFALCKLGCTGGLALAIVFALRTVLATEAAPFLSNMVLPAEADSEAGVNHGSPRGNDGLRESPSRTDRAGPSSSHASALSAESSGSFPEQALWEELEQPLIPVEERLDKLSKRRFLFTYGVFKTEELDWKYCHYEIQAQVDVEIELEKYLRHHAYTPESINANRDKIRGFVFYPNGRPIPEETLLFDLEQMKENFAQSRPFREIEGAIKRMDLFLRRPGDPF